MRKLFLFIISNTVILLFLFNNTSCKRENFTQQIKQLDSIITQVDAMSIEINGVDSLSVMNLKKYVNEDVNWIKDSLTKETMTTASVFLIKVRTAKKLLDSFPYEYSTMKSELKYSQAQLVDLHNDLSKGSIEADLANKYLADEKKAFLLIASHFKKMFGRLESVKDYPDIREEFYKKIHLK
jgi:hypothetical protein